MYQVAITCRYDPLTEIPDREIVLSDEFDTREQAELRGMRWRHYRPGDDVAIRKVVEDILCKHCREKIEEVPGAVLHKWVHKEFHNYTCWSNALTQAEPKEEP